jgi:hypothetical protein
MWFWGLLHLQAAWSVSTLRRSMPSGMASGRVLQDAWHLLWFSTRAILAAVMLPYGHRPRTGPRCGSMAAWFGLSSEPHSLDGAIQRHRAGHRHEKE